MREQNSTNEERYSLFLKLFMEHQGRLLGHILRLMPDYTVAEDILQETALVLWQKFDTFEVDSSFMAWARQIAKNKVLDYIKKSKVRTIVQFDVEVIEALAAEEPIANDNQYSLALQGCIERLEDKSKQLIRLRYIKRLKVKEIAGQLGLTPNTLSKYMSRVHCMLRRCIEEKMTLQGGSHGQ